MTKQVIDKLPFDRDMREDYFVDKVEHVVDRLMEYLQQKDI